ncbi:MAG: hypothetical protein OEW04_09590 [Nitrospirota bacterium]|nr:hypothetical protein [Nitrospirota bacterium]
MGIYLNPGTAMKYHSFKRLTVFLSCFVLFFLFNASVSRAEQPNKEPAKKILSGMNIKKIQVALHSTGSLPVLQAMAQAREMASSYDVKFDLNERFKAFLSFGQPYINDLSGSDSGQNYNAVFGFLIELR